MKPKIVIDGIPLLSSFLTGIGRYTYEISKEVKKTSSFDVNFYYGYYSKKLIEPSSKTNLKSIKTLASKSPILKKLARKALMLYGRFFCKEYDLYWVPNFIPLDSIKAKKVVTSIHDFSFILYKDLHPKERIEYFENNFFKNILRSDLIITGSEFTKKEILDRLDFNEEQVKVIYHGIDHNLFKVTTDLNVNFELPKKFILSVGSIEPRKNLIGLLKAYNNLDNEIKKQYHLVLAGFKGWNNDEIMRLINANNNYIHYLGYVSDEDLVKVYNHASLFVYPSFYEGFGIPPLEAMACGTPVVTSNVSSLPEVGGDAVLYCDPYDIEDIAKQIKTVLDDKVLQEKMMQKGLERAKRFTWEKAAQDHLTLFRSLIDSGK